MPELEFSCMQSLAALRAMQLSLDDRAASVSHFHRRTVRCIPTIAPLPEHHQRLPQVTPLRREHVLVPDGPLLILDRREDPVFHEGVESLTEHVPGYSKP